MFLVFCDGWNGWFEKQRVRMNFVLNSARLLRKVVKLSTTFCEETLSQTKKMNCLNVLKKAEYLKEMVNIWALIDWHSEETAASVREEIREDCRYTIVAFCEAVGLSRKTCDRLFCKKVEFADRTVAKFMRRALTTKQKRSLVQPCKQPKEYCENDLPQLYLMHRYWRWSKAQSGN